MTDENEASIRQETLAEVLGENHPGLDTDGRCVSCHWRLADIGGSLSGWCGGRVRDGRSTWRAIRAAQSAPPDASPLPVDATTPPDR